MPFAKEFTRPVATALFMGADDPLLLRYLYL